MIFEDKGFLDKFTTIGYLIKHLQHLNLLSDSIVVVTSTDNECMYCMFGNRDLRLLLEHYKNSSYFSCHHYSVYTYREYPVDFFQILLFDNLQPVDSPTVFL
ncbi:hypothetical protein [Solobacterium moorei]